MITRRTDLEGIMKDLREAGIHLTETERNSDGMVEMHFRESPDGYERHLTLHPLPWYKGGGYEVRYWTLPIHLDRAFRKVFL